MPSMRMLQLIAVASAAALATGGAAVAQGVGGRSALDIGASIRLENERRWTEGQVRSLQAEAGRLSTDAAVRNLQARRAPDAALAMRQTELDAVAAESLARATQAASTRNAARLRAADPAYDRSLRALGYATGLPIGPR